jgi:hypothetical protein
MIAIVLIAWLTFAAWVYRDAEGCHAADAGYHAIRFWSPRAWTILALLVPGFGGLHYLHARRLHDAEAIPTVHHWQFITAPAGWTLMLMAGFLLGTLWSAPTSTALVVPAAVNATTVSRMPWGQAVLPTATLAKVRYAVTGHERTRVIRYGTGETTATGQFVVLNLAVRNIGGQPEVLMPSRFLLVDAAGRQYSSSFAGETAMLFRTGQSLMLEALQPGLERRGELVFDVPATAGGLRLTIHGPGTLPEKAVLPVS